MALEKLTVPVLVESPTLKVPVPAPVIRPLKITLVLAAAAILLLPVAKVMALLIVLPVVLPSNEPPPIVTVPDDRLLPLAPPVATDKVPSLIVVVPA